MTASETSEELSDVVTVYGEPFLAYVLGCHGQELLLESLSEGQGQVVEFLRSQSGRIPQSNDTEGFMRFSSLAGLNTYVPESGMSLTNLLRLTAGGELPEISRGDDDLLYELQVLARDNWASYLLPAPSGPGALFWMSNPLGIYQHPSTQTLCAIILSDPDLFKLFPDADPPEAADDPLIELSKIQSRYISNSGHGGSLQFLTFVGHLISDGVWRTLVREGTLSWSGLTTSLAQTAAAIRKLAAGRAVDVPVLVGFNGLVIGDDLTIETAAGTLRAPRQADTDILLESDGGTITAVLETAFPLRLLDIDSWGTAGAFEEREWARLQPRIDDAHRTFQRTIDVLRLALLLASDGDKPLLARDVARVVLDPMLPGGSQSWDVSRHGVASNQVPSEKAAAIVEWHATLMEKHVTSLDIGMRRLLAATTSRQDANDAFVDAVVCWENLFGTTSETTFRVTGAIAKLLEAADFSQRWELQKELKKLYDKRSKLIHGGAEPSAREAVDVRDRAVEIAVNCLRVLYRDRPDLLELASESRSAQVLLE